MNQKIKIIGNKWNKLYKGKAPALGWGVGVPPAFNVYNSRKSIKP